MNDLLNKRAKVEVDIPETLSSLPFHVLMHAIEFIGRLQPCSVEAVLEVDVKHTDGVEATPSDLKESRRRSLESRLPPLTSSSPVYDQLRPRSRSRSPGLLWSPRYTPRHHSEPTPRYRLVSSQSAVLAMQLNRAMRRRWIDQRASCTLYVSSPSVESEMGPSVISQSMSHYIALMSVVQAVLSILR